MLLLAYWVVLLPIGLAALSLVGFLVYIWWTYCPIIVRIFEETPVFAPLRVSPCEAGENVRFLTDDGRELAGSYFKTFAAKRLGVIVFCPEYLGDRWSCKPYTQGLPEAGFDVFSFDFRNHGESQTDPAYLPMQWVSDLVLVDLQAAIRYVQSRPDHDAAGVGLFGISRGGGAALCVASMNPAVWAVVTDGAFPTRGTMLAYVMRWASIPCKSQIFLRFAPRWIYAFAGWTGRKTSELRRGRFHPNLERAVSQIAPRPWLMIHGQKDAYIGPEIAMALFDHAREPKQSWIVPGAKHNRCREATPTEYQNRLVEFFQAHAPRRPDLSVSPREIPSQFSTPASPDRSSHHHQQTASPCGTPTVEEEIAAF